MMVSTCRAASLLLALSYGAVESFVTRPQVLAPAVRNHGNTFIPTIAEKDSSSPSSWTSSALRMADTATGIDNVIEELGTVKKEFYEEAAEAKTANDFEQLRRKYMSKKGPVNQAMKYMKSLPPEDKPKLGAVVNTIKEELDTVIATQKEELRKKAILDDLERQQPIDPTMPGIDAKFGHRHPIPMTMEKAVDIFIGLGYDCINNAVDSPEVESDYYCFEALNCPRDHPARDMQDTFYLSEDKSLMLRTHTSSVQVRALEKRGPPLRIVAPGRVYRRDDVDATHSWMFHQVEILAVEKFGNLRLCHLKGTVDYFLKNMLGERVKTRYRGSYFPFTCPSMEVDVLFRGKWLEVLGCGMVDPNVLEMAAVDPDEYGGFAAGFGVERFAMVIHEIKDIREFYRNDMRFLSQFPRYTYQGWDNFLKGEVAEPEEDMRRSEVPSRMVETWDELEQLYAEEDGVELKKLAPAYDISNLDIRVGIVEDVWKHEAAENLFCVETDLGDQGSRLIVSLLMPYYKADELKGQKVLVLTNVKEQVFGGCPSHGMILSALSATSEHKEIIQPPEDAAVGERVMVDGYDGPPAHPVDVEKMDMLTHIWRELKTNAEGVATFMDKPLMTVSGECKAQKGLADSLIK